MIHIRAATEDDIPWILDIENEAISPPWTHGALLSEIYNDDSYFIIAEQDRGTRGGFAVIRQVGDDGELLQIAVDRRSRRSRVGDLLMADALEYAVKNTLQSVFLEVRRSNTAAIGLYMKHGFKSIRVRKDYYDDPVEDAIIMVKKPVR